MQREKNTKEESDLELVKKFRRKCVWKFIAILSKFKRTINN